MERLTICLRVLAERSDVLTQVFGVGSREALGRLLQTREAERKKGKKVRKGGREGGKEGGREEGGRDDVHVCIFISNASIDIYNV